MRQYAADRDCRQRCLHAHPCFLLIDGSTAVQQFVVRRGAPGDADFALRGGRRAVRCEMFVDSFELAR